MRAVESAGDFDPGDDVALRGVVGAGRGAEGFGAARLHATALGKVVLFFGVGVGVVLGVVLGVVRFGFARRKFFVETFPEAFA